MRTIAALALTLTLTSCSDGSGQMASGGLDSLVASLDPNAQPEGTVSRRLLSGEAAMAPGLSFSPDGRSRLIIDWSEEQGSGFTRSRFGSLAIQDLETGEARILVRAVPIEDDINRFEFSQSGRFSRDGRRVAYSWARVLPPSEPGAEREEHNELRIVDVAGGEPRVLLDAHAMGWSSVDPLDWSPDGGSIVARGYVSDAAASESGEQVHLFVVSVDDGTTRILKRFEILDQPEAFFSPDGRFVAYSGQTVPGQAGDIFLFELDSGRETRVFGPVAAVLGWSDDGGHLYFWSDRAGSSIWALPLGEAGRTGDPVLIRRDVQGIAEGEVIGGRLFYIAVSETPRMYTAALDLASGRLLSEPTPVSGNGRYSPPVWSPDGERLAYARTGPTGGPITIAVRSADGTDLREFAVPDPFGAYGMLAGAVNRWMPDDRLLVPAGSPVVGRHLLTLDLADGQFTVGFAFDMGYYRPIAADGRTVYEPGGATDLVTGETRPFLADRPADEPVEGCRIGGAMALSPDETTIAFAGNPLRVDDDFCVGTVPVEGGTPTILYRASRPQDPMIAWSADGRDLLFTLEPGGTLRELWTVPAAGGTARELFTFDGLHRVAVNPDNRRIAFIGGHEAREIWVMEGLDEFVANR